MNNNNGTANITIGSSLSVLLTVAFVILKLCRVIDWSWVWVLSPLWISVAVGILVVIVFVWFVGWLKG